MDKYERQLEQLAQRIRTLEMEKLPKEIPSEFRNMVVDLDLIPVANQVSTPAKLSEEMILPILKDLGFSCKQGQDYVSVQTEEGERIQITYSRFPIILVTNGFIIDESEESLIALREAVSQITNTWDMVKAAVDDESKHLAIYIHARHMDVASFKENIRFYIEHIIAATDNLRELHRNYERERFLSGFMTREGKQVLS